MKVVVLNSLLAWLSMMPMRLDSLMRFQKMSGQLGGGTDDPRREFKQWRNNHSFVADDSRWMPCSLLRAYQQPQLSRMQWPRCYSFSGWNINIPLYALVLFVSGQLTHLFLAAKVFSISWPTQCPRDGQCIHSSWPRNPWACRSFWYVLSPFLAYSYWLIWCP